MPEASVRTHGKPTTQVLWFTVFAKPSQCATIAIRPEAGKVLLSTCSRSSEHKNMSKCQTWDMACQILTCS